MKSNTTRWVLGHKISPVFVSGEYDMVIGETPAQVPGPPPHYHKEYNEVFLVIEGEMEFMVDGEVKIVKAGESVDLPPNKLHTFGNKSAANCKWVNIHSPKGFSSFFNDMGIPDDWVLTPGNSQKEIHQAFHVFSQSAVRVSQSGASFSQTALGGFGS